MPEVGKGRKNKLFCSAHQPQQRFGAHLSPYRFCPLPPPHDRGDLGLKQTEDASPNFPLQSLHDARTADARPIAISAPPNAMWRGPFWNTTHHHMLDVGGPDEAPYAREQQGRERSRSAIAVKQLLEDCAMQTCRRPTARRCFRVPLAPSARVKME